MNNIIKYTIITLSTSLSLALSAGNPERSGQAGGAELQINPFARSSGWGFANTTGVKGLESTFINIAGLAGVKQTELLFSRVGYVAGININTFGFAQKLGGEKGQNAISLGLTSFNYGDIMRTTTAQPDGGLGTYRISTSILSAGYARRFTDKIYGGVQFKFYSQGTSDVRSNAVAIDAGVQYATTTKPGSIKTNDLRFAVALKDIGPDYRPTGDGLAVKSLLSGNDFSSTTSLRSAKTELPTSVHIGMAYDFQLDKEKALYMHKLTTAFNFTNNSFSNNQTSLGLEYSYNELFMLRGAFIYEKNIFTPQGPEGRQSMFTGFAIGMTAEPSLSKENGNTMAIDVSYRTTNPFNGVLSIGLRLNLAQTKRANYRKKVLTAN